MNKLWDNILVVIIMMAMTVISAAFAVGAQSNAGMNSVVCVIWSIACGVGVILKFMTTDLKDRNVIISWYFAAVCIAAMIMAWV